jgi:uncharacterized protein
LRSLRNYSIPFTGLALGKHHFEFDVKDDFFEEFEYSLVKKADLKCEVDMEKQETMLILDFHISGTVGATCDRCLTEYDQAIDVHEQQIVKFSDEDIDEDDEILTLNKNEHEIMLAGLIYEYINVAVPLITTCGGEDDTSQCDKEMLEKLNDLSANNEQDENPDPRWDALKKIK